MLSDTQIRDLVTTYLRENGPTSRCELNRTIPASPNRFVSVLERMRDDGVIERTGERFNEMRWRFTPEARRRLMRRRDGSSNERPSLEMSVLNG